MWPWWRPEEIDRLVRKLEKDTRGSNRLTGKKKSFVFSCENQSEEKQQSWQAINT